MSGLERGPTRKGYWHPFIYLGPTRKAAPRAWPGTASGAASHDIGLVCHERGSRLLGVVNCLCRNLLSVFACTLVGIDVAIGSA
ncbi:hypothetical protein BCV70DRAFT_27730 [Testicularia cyperi]|uniref:Uncharacterized protein n=1 Tax=Testicularia cyperi TaxID=1882483 RepID=A0A317XL45_9BASI|nr:hypothetical protein BCV70DRAFT_27730 [Testicularia cyperi]